MKKVKILLCCSVLMCVVICLIVAVTSKSESVIKVAIYPDAENSVWYFELQPDNNLKIEIGTKSDQSLLEGSVTEQITDTFETQLEETEADTLRMWTAQLQNISESETIIVRGASYIQILQDNFYGVYQMADMICPQEALDMGNFLIEKAKTLMPNP